MARSEWHEERDEQASGRTEDCNGLMSLLYGVMYSLSCYGVSEPIAESLCVMTVVNRTSEKDKKFHSHFVTFSPGLSIDLIFAMPIPALPIFALRCASGP